MLEFSSQNQYTFFLLSTQQQFGSCTVFLKGPEVKSVAPLKSIAKILRLNRSRVSVQPWQTYTLRVAAQFWCTGSNRTHVKSWWHYNHIPQPYTLHWQAKVTGYSNFRVSLLNGHSWDSRTNSYTLLANMPLLLLPSWLQPQAGALCSTGNKGMLMCHFSCATSLLTSLSVQL